MSRWMLLMGMEHIRQRRAIDDDDEGGEADAVRRGSVLSAAGAMSKERKGKIGKVDGLFFSLSSALVQFLLTVAILAEVEGHLLLVADEPEMNNLGYKLTLLMLACVRLDGKGVEVESCGAVLLQMLDGCGDIIVELGQSLQVDGRMLTTDSSESAENNQSGFGHLAIPSQSALFLLYQDIPSPNALLLCYFIVEDRNIAGQPRSVIVHHSHKMFSVGFIIFPYIASSIGEAAPNREKRAEGLPAYPDNMDYQRWPPPPVYYEPPRTGILHKLFETVGTLFMNLFDMGGIVFEQLPILRNLGKGIFDIIDKAKPWDETPARQYVEAKPWDETPARQYVEAKPWDETPARQYVQAKPWDETPARQYVQAKPWDETPARQYVEAKSWVETPARQYVQAARR
ncbi:hypothetical protein PRIPAC_81037 [Pristionchus pacificus]|uniref:Uncharacterized protein n=1 Tax=Pristionchus pacificus TaxID=54126 RepID=A0A2A6CJB3_PRIPA|nr:hypothetical protein PRIPAC_81037 [Pristionchus pacificus]|eukprot:PDM78219.1 hypothetical protein PRIPAC_30798 [Pristionchus pacificus]